MTFLRRIVRLLPIVLCSTDCVGLAGDDPVLLRFEGTVVAEADGKPLAGVTVSLEQAFFVWQTSVAADTTDSNGRFVVQYSTSCKRDTDLYNAPGDAFLLVARAPGYDSQSSVNISRTLRCVKAVQTVQFRLRPPPPPIASSTVGT